MTVETHPSVAPISDASQIDLSLIIPCYNEEDVVRNTAVRLARVFRDQAGTVELVLVDNGSQDRTGEVIDQLIAEQLPVTKVAVRVNQGYGNGILQGLKLARGRLVGFVAADGQVDAVDVGRAYEVAAHARAPSLVKVRRRFRMDGMVRKIVSILYNLLMVLLFGNLGSIDINGNPKIMPREYLERMNLQSRDWFLDAEVMIKARRVGLKVFEMNVIAQMREGGRSNVHGSTIWEFLVNVARYRFGAAGRLGAFAQPNAGQERMPPQPT